MESDRIFERLVEEFYQPLFRFALSLTQTEPDACDLVQQTYYLWATKGHQLREASKVKMWLFTTLHREFLNRRRRIVRFPHHEVSQVDAELPAVEPITLDRLDAPHALQALGQLDEIFRAPIALYFLEDYSYQEIADALDIPLGTVKSRLARGLQQLKRLLQDPSGGGISSPQSASP